MKKTRKMSHDIFIVTECPYSGILRAILEHAKLFKKLGFRIFFVIPETARNRYGEVQEKNILQLTGYGEILFYPLRRKYKYIFRDKNKLQKLFSGKKNIIVLSYSGYAGKICRLLYKGGHIENLYHVPQCIDIIRRPYLQRVAEWFFEKNLAPYVTYYLSCAPSESFGLVNNYNVPVNKILTVPNYIIGSPLKECGKSKNVDFIILGRVSKDKKVDLLLSTAAILGMESKMTVVGQGQEHNLLKKKFPLVNFLGYIPNNKINDLLLESRFFLSASIIEGMPFSLIEAMGQGVVPIVSNVAGHNDIVIHGYNGFLFNNQEELTELIFQAMLLKNTDKYTLMSKAAIETIDKLCVYSKEVFNNHFVKYE